MKQTINVRRIIFIVCLFLMSHVFADNRSLDSVDLGYWSVQIENDLFGSGDDRFYTNGFQVNYMKKDAFPLWLDRWMSFFPLFIQTDHKGGGYSLGQKMFTPENVQSEVLVKDDRPYAGWLYGSTSIVSLIKEDAYFREMNAFELTIGIVGPSSLAGDTQNGLHELIESEVANGWKNQLKDELGFNVTYVRQSEYFNYFGQSFEYSWSPHRVLALGNVYTYAGGGLMFRLGQSLKNDIGPPNIRPGFSGASFFGPTGTGKNWYVFGGLEGRLMARNIFLDGNTFQESHRVDKIPFVLDFQYGIAYQYGQLRFAFSHVLRSKEFEGQTGHVSFGSFNVSFFLN